MSDTVLVEMPASLADDLRRLFEFLQALPDEAKLDWTSDLLRGPGCDGKPATCCHRHVDLGGTTEAVLAALKAAV